MRRNRSRVRSSFALSKVKEYANAHYSEREGKNRNIEPERSSTSTNLSNIAAGVSKRAGVRGRGCRMDEENRGQRMAQELHQEGAYASGVCGSNAASRERAVKVAARFFWGPPSNSSPCPLLLGREGGVGAENECFLTSGGFGTIRLSSVQRLVDSLTITDAPSISAGDSAGCVPRGRVRARLWIGFRHARGAPRGRFPSPAVPMCRGGPAFQA